MRKTTKFCIGILTGILSLAIPLNAQAVASAEISGTVSDPSGSAVAGANIIATQTETGAARTAVTSATGAYLLPNLPIGPYTLEVKANGFGTLTRKGIILSVGQNVSIPISLPLGSINQQVQVNADAAMVEAHDTSVSTVIDDQRVVELPLNGREVTSLVILSGAAVNASNVGDMVGSKTYGSSNIAGSTAISVAGGQSNSTNFMMDGGDNNHNYSNVNLPFPFPDAVQEFNVQTSGLSARYGLHPGGAMNVVTKSGTNQYHGDLFEFIRNGDLNARNFFAATHDLLKRNQFGGTVGGPILKNRLFFFFGYQGTRVRSAPPQSISYVPTTAALSGDFSALESSTCQSSGKARTITNPSTGQPFPGATIPVSLFNPQAVALVKYLPAATNSCGKITYAVPSPESENQYIGRGDWNINAKHTFFARYFNAGLTNPPAPFDNNFLFTSRAGLTDGSESLTLGDTYTFSPTILNSLHVTGTKIRVNRSPQPDFINPHSVGLNVSELSANFLYMSISGYFNIGCGSCAPAVYASGTVQVADDIDIVRGRHHLSFGGNYIYEQLNEDNVFLGNGYWTFNGSATGDGLADFLLGVPNQFQQGNPALGNPRQNYFGFYAQDDFQATPHLQLHFGVRWEPFLPAADTANRIDHFDPVAFAAGTKSKVYVNAPPGLSFVGDPGVSRSFTSTSLNDFEPRIGFAWDPTGSGKQTIRSSYSIFYDSPEMNYSTHPGQGAPWGSTITLSSPAGGLTNPFAGYPGGNPFPSPVPPTANQAFPTSGAYYNIPANLKPTYSQQWDLSYQRQLSTNWLITATYLGNKTTHSWVQTEENPGVYIPGTCSGKACSTTANLNQRRVLYLQNPTNGAYFSTLALSDGGANSEYEGLLFSVRRRMSNHYTVLANYTYSHCISEGNFVGELAGPGYQNPYNRDADRGNCAFDLRQIFNLSVVAASPVFQGNRIKRAALNNWQIAPIVSARSGAAFTPTTGTDNSMTGVGLDRPNMVGNPYIRNTTSLLWLSPAAFAANPIGTFGNAGPYSLYGPAYVNVDLALSRKFIVREHQSLDVRFEAFNSTNTTHFAVPVAALNNARFGQITSAGDPRILQFAMKYQF